MDDAALIEEEAAKADIVLRKFGHCVYCSIANIKILDTADSSDHEISAKAIEKGLAKAHTKEHPGYWLHLSGTGILCWKDMETKTYGEAPPQEPYDDLEGVSKLTSLPDMALHRNVDKIVLASGSDSVKTAIVCPPTIYGPGRGPGNQRSRQVYNLVKITLQKGQAAQLGKGLTEWDNLHIQDLSSLLLLLAEAAVAGPAPNDDEIWNERGYFLAENGHHVWGEVSKQAGEVAFEKGYIKTKEVFTMDVEEAKELAGFEAVSWGLNSKGFAKRARKYLGWKPTGRSLEDEMPFIVDSEAKREGLVPGHVAVVSGTA